MPRYLAWRLLSFLPTLLLASVVVFGVLRVLPGDVALVILGGGGDGIVDPGQVEQLREQLGLNAPLHVQYGNWLLSLVDGTFGGRSLETRQAVGDLIGRQLPVTLLLTRYSLVFAVAVFVPLGAQAAVRRGRWQDTLLRAVAVAGQAVPGLILALTLLLSLAFAFHWSPPLIYPRLTEDPIWHVQVMALPVLVLGWGLGAHLLRMTRSSLLDVLGQDYIRTARSKGLTQSITLWRHAMRNALVSVTSLAGVQAGALLGGVVVLEAVFGLPGLGRGLVQAVTTRDYPIVQTISLLLVAMTLLLNLALDIAHSYMDPRITHGREPDA
jgi:peptide/nickel transport system permease protein